MVQTGRRPSGALLAVVVLVAAVLVGGVAVFALAESTTDDDPRATTSMSGRVSDEDYADVQTGMMKREVEQLLLPATAVDVTVLDEYELREPDAPSAACVYYESAGGTADDVYRFCFEEDRLVDKTVILPPADGVTGGP